LKVSNWTTCIDDEAHDDEAHIEIGTGAMIAAAQPDEMNTKVGKLCAE
jgi:hypothetical protein